MKNPRQIIGPPLLTEKNNDLREDLNQYVFRVALDANKIEIQKAIEAIFEVKVEQVRTMCMTGKVKRMGRFEGKRSDWKKAIVTLVSDDSIELFESI